ERSGVEWPIEELVLGQTVPQRESFYGPPTLAARLGFERVAGPCSAQACATSVACIHAAAASQAEDSDGARLVITTDRVSNSPQLIWPAPGRPGGAPEQEHWTLDNFARDPWGGLAMGATDSRPSSQRASGPPPPRSMPAASSPPWKTAVWSASARTPPPPMAPRGS